MKRGVFGRNILRENAVVVGVLYEKGLVHLRICPRFSQQLQSLKKSEYIT